MFKSFLQTTARFLKSNAHITVALVVLVGVLWYFGAGVTTAAWYSSSGGDSWDNRIKITINASQVDSTLTDFPVYVDLADLPADFHTNVRSDGGDIRVASADGETEVPREVVSYDDTADTGELHFKAPSLSATTDTDFYIYYGNSSATDYADSATYGTHNVWTAYEGVWHMGTSVLTDSTGKAADSTTNTGTVSGDTKLSGLATEYSGTSQQSIIPGYAEISDWRASDLYWWGWMESDNWSRQMEKANQYFLIQFSGGGDSGPLIKPNNDTASVGTLSTGVYYQIGGRFTQTSGNDGILDAVLNGAINDTTINLPVIEAVGNTDLYLGSDDSGTYMDGRIDEFRISGYKSDDWIAAEYTNQNTPTTFYTVGTEETETTAPTVTTSAATNVATSTATVNGEITDTGGENADERGFVYATSTQSDPGNTAPGSSDYSSSVNETGSFATSTFTGSLSDLNPDTTYYVRAYAHNSEGYSYGGEVSFTTDAESSGETYYGEAGTVSTPADGTWTTINFARSYSDPVVVGTVNTDNNTTDGGAGGNGSDGGLVFESRNISSGSAEVRICHSRGSTANGCQSGSTLDESAGYLVLDLAEVNDGSVDGIEAGTFSADDFENGDNDAVTFSKSFTSSPFVFAAVELADPLNSAEVPVEARVKDVTTSGFTGGICHQANNDSCLSNHATETVAWVAVDPAVFSPAQAIDGGTINPRDSNWGAVTFSGFSQTPVVLVEQQTNNGGQNGEIDEARGLSASGGDVRFCELDAESSCNSHVNEEMAWTAFTSGDLSVAGSVSPPTVTTSAATNVATSTATANGEITDTGGENADERGFVYATSTQSDPGNTAPGSSDYSSSVNETGSFATSTFTGSLSDLNPDTTYYVRAYAHNSEGYSYGGEVSFTTDAADTTPPTPDPMTFVTEPDDASNTSIDMTATTASDGDGSTPTEYLFTYNACGTNSGTGGSDSGWQESTSYTDTGLEVNHCYGYTVNARDSLGNTTATSSVSEAYTAANTPGTPTLSGATETTLDITNDENSNPAHTEYAVYAISAADASWDGQWVDENGDPSATEVWMTDVTIDSLTMSGLTEDTSYTISTKARNVDGGETVLSAEVSGTTNAAAVPSGPWLDSSWPYRIKVTINASQVDSTLTDFPVYVDLADLPADFHTNVRSDGGDIRVASADGETEVPREVVSYDDTADTGELHFKAPSLSATTDTDFYIYYGNSSATDYADSATYGTHNVWTNGYGGIWHMEQDPSGAAPQVVDSTANSNDGTSSGTMTSADLVVGQFGQALDYDGADDYIDIPQHASLEPSQMTFSGYVKLNTSLANQPNSYPAIISKRGGGGYAAYFFVGDEELQVNISTEDSSITMQPVVSSYDWTQWHQVAFSYNGSQVKVYVNGVEIDSAALTGAITPSTMDLFIAEITDYTGSNLDGSTDEFRIATTARSDEWISAEYVNQSTPNTFYAAGSQETGPSGDSGSGSEDSVIEIHGGEIRGGVEFR